MQLWNSVEPRFAGSYNVCDSKPRVPSFINHLKYVFSPVVTIAL